MTYRQMALNKRRVL